MLSLEVLHNLAAELLDQMSTREEYDTFMSEAPAFAESLADLELEKVSVDLSLSPVDKVKRIKVALSLSLQKNTLINEINQQALERGFFDFFSYNNFNLFLDILVKLARTYKSARLTFAIELRDIDILHIKQKLELKFAQKIFLSIKIKPNIIGGFILEKDSQIFDSSVEKALEGYRHDWVNSFTVIS